MDTAGGVCILSGYRVVQFQVSLWFFALRVVLTAVLGALRFSLAQPYFDPTTLATRSANDTNFKKEWAAIRAIRRGKNCIVL